MVKPIVKLMGMKEKNYFIGVKFNQSKTLYQKVVKHELNNSELIRKALKHYLQEKEVKPKLNQEFNQTYNQDLLTIMQQQHEKHTEDLQNQNEYLQNRLDYFITLKTPFLNRIFQKQITQNATKEQNKSK